MEVHRSKEQRSTGDDLPNVKNEAANREIRAKIGARHRREDVRGNRIRHISNTEPNSERNLRQNRHRSKKLPVLSLTSDSG
jgi:hypothetical protein